MNTRAGEFNLGRAVFRLIVTLIVGAALAFVAAPFFAFRAVKAAARDGDGYTLAQLIDYPAVRQGLRPQVAAKPVAGPAPPDIWTDPIGAVRRAIEPVVPVPPNIEPFLGAPGLYDLTRGYAPGAAPPDARSAWLPQLRYWDPNRARFIARPRSKDAKRKDAQSKDAKAEGVIFTFERRDLLTWKLVQIRLPQAA